MILMLIDDDKDIIDINKKYLSDEGYTVYTFLSADSAFSSLKKINPDLKS